MSKQEDNLLDEKFEIEEEILYKLGILIDASWDSKTVQLEIEKLMKQREKIYEELIELDEKKKYDKHTSTLNDTKPFIDSD